MFNLNFLPFVDGLSWFHFTFCASELRLKKLFEERESLRDQVRRLLLNRFERFYFVRTVLMSVWTGEVAEVSAGSEDWRSPEYRGGGSGERDGFSPVGPAEWVPVLMFYLLENKIWSQFSCFSGDANRQISELKFKLVKSEQEVTALEQNVSIFIFCDLIWCKVSKLL